MLDRYLKPRWFEEDKKSRKAIGIFYRLSKTVLLDNVIDHLAILTQHEVFGHGSRYREFGYKNNSYSLSLFPPYQPVEELPFNAHKRKRRLECGSDKSR